MNFFSLANSRYSVRHYAATQLDAADLDACLEAARLAPSACNSQPWHFIVIDDPAILPAAREAALGKPVAINKFARQAPVLIAVVEERPKLSAALGGALKGHGYAHIDIGLAVGQFCLAATERGLGSCILGWFNERAIKKLLSIPRTRRVPLLITLGYPAENSKPTAKLRRPRPEMSSFNRYRKG
ncbi:MAG: NAD(P)H nitroreductase [Spirochaetes bacterium GWD1_61_31]|nr:MAG: NAD(P)H nitroreductase [Spirochaetes bacterium GWB1_60_80]OHD28473.1 MAG: NAD(P)H nitroreductase [Spirochaetes bacterium GWC1_61_12]OHD40258.1 MAG: NAD(P)H nitroreductase [Spirochaetes bacterium GWD1_61_31]OHD45916.1 MAG: NAD(P)H nitroreductase [Spirochaetes bacterium GWE1_60_18]OHD58499.1 MAG: NAD(P)H nitroreductase [Spirochaetes bacterium GWF1_60_12]HAW85386.1 NAD(P)H nitroreductase [Spirochaetaceae bacterium]